MPDPTVFAGRDPILPDNPAAVEASSSLAVADRLAHVLTQISTLEESLRHAYAEPTATPQEAALLRLLRGHPTPQDASLVAVQVRGSRVLVVRASPHSCAALRSRLNRSRREQLVATHDKELVVLVSGFPRPASASSRPTPAEQLATTIARDNRDAAVGVSSTLGTSAELAGAYQEAREAAAMALDTEQRWLAADQNWAVLTARRIAPMLSRCLTLDNPLARLRRHDHEHGTDLLQTVSTWLAHNCDTARSSEALSVHPNTLRYRLRRAETVSGLDLADPLVRVLAVMYGVTPWSTR